MGNQPHRSNLPRRYSGSIRHTRKMVNNAKRFLGQKKYSKAAKVSIAAGLKDSGKNYLAASVLAAAQAYSKYQKTGQSQEIPKITAQTLTKVIRDQKFDVTKLGRSHLKTSINTTLSSLMKDD